MDTKIKFNWRDAFLLFIAVFIVYFPGLSGGFIYDDYYNILQNYAIYNSELSFSDAWLASMSGTSGPLGRPLAMLSFYLNYQLSGFSPLSFKLFNIAIHVINSFLIFIVTNRLLNVFVNQGQLPIDKIDSRQLALWVAILWAIHPINLTAVLYIVQRMTSMSAMFTLFGIYFYLNLREIKAPNYKEIITRLLIIIFLGMLAALCKENGLLLFLFLLVIEMFLFQWRVETTQECWCIRFFYFFVLVTPLCFVSLMFLNGDLTASYSGRPFDLTERMLTEFRVIWFYIVQILLPQANLFGLHHDDFVVSTSIFEPNTTFISIVAIVFIISISIKYSKSFPWFGFGVIFFFAGHMMESTILPLNLVHEHRNYLPSLGILIVFVLLLRMIISRIKLVNGNIFFIIITILFSSITISRAYDWSNLILLGERLAQRHPNSITANYEMGYAYSKLYEQTNDPVFAMYAKIALQKAQSLSDSNMQPAIALAHINSMSGDDENHELINKIATDFRKGNTSVIEVISLRQFVNCHVEAICNISEVTMKTLFANLLDNESLQGRLRDDVLYIYSTYLFTIPEEEAQALNIMQDIASRNPDTFEYHVKLVSMLLETGKSDEADFLMGSLTKRYGIKWEVIEKQIK